MESLKKFADKDWSNPEYVADMRKTRIKYHEEHKHYSELIGQLRSDGCSNSEVAETLVNKRNSDRMAYYLDDDGNIIDIDLYNQALEHCPTYEDLKKGWKGKKPKTDLEIIESACKSNPAYDACCGLYGH